MSRTDAQVAADAASVRVQDLPPSLLEDTDGLKTALTDYFSEAGTVVRVNAGSKTAFVQFESAESVPAACALAKGGKQIEGVVPAVSPANERRVVSVHEMVEAQCIWPAALLWAQDDVPVHSRPPKADPVAIGPSSLASDVDVTLPEGMDEAPPLFDTFSASSLHPILIDNLLHTGISHPTPIQRHSIPLLLRGGDLLGSAETGSGKTLAYLLPLLDRLARHGATPRVSGRQGAPDALVLLPTRELAVQVYGAAAMAAERLCVRVGVAYGGEAEIRKRFDVAAQVLVATPGVLRHLVEVRALSLGAVRYEEGKISMLVLDEADQLFDKDFLLQIRPLIRQMPGRAHRQTILFSATLDDGDTLRFATTYMNPIRSRVIVRTSSSGPTIPSSVHQTVLDLRGRDKNDALIQLLDRTDDGAAIVFVERKIDAECVASHLISQNFNADALHGDRSQERRNRTIAAFRSGATTVLVTTNVAARGLDIAHVSHVINYDLPSDIDTYIHRVGRTGRAGRAGRATSFFTERDYGIARRLADAVEAGGQARPEWVVEEAERVLGGGESYREWDRMHNGGVKGEKVYASTSVVGRAVLNDEM